MTDDTGAGRPPGQPIEGGDSQPILPTIFTERPAMQLPEQLGGRYRIKGKLGGGGMGAVYLVHNLALNREEALKVPHLDAGDDPAVRARFLREAQTAAGLDHPNICPIHDAGYIDGVYYLTMRLLPGKPLSQFTRRPQTPIEAVKLVVKLARALQYAHGKGVIHRDLKPQNIMMCPGAGPVIFDFGLAKQTLQPDRKLTQTGMAMGTPAYMPPEQVKGEWDRIGPACDVYSLGVIFFEVLTGRLPFDGSANEVMGKVLFVANPLPSHFLPGLHPALDAVCGKAMAKEPQDRYRSMKEFVGALQELQRTLAAKEPSRSATMPAGGKFGGDMVDEPTMPPEPPPLPKPVPEVKRPSMVSKTVADPRPAERRKPINARQGPSAPETGRGSSLVIWLCLVLLLGSAAVVGLFMLNGGDKKPGKSETTKTLPVKEKGFSGGKAKPVDNEEKGKFQKEKGIARPKDKGPNPLAEAFKNDFEMHLVHIPGGRFTMGSSKKEQDEAIADYEKVTGSKPSDGLISAYRSEGPQHEIQVSEFYLGIHEVTQKQFRAVMGYNPSYFSKNAKGKDGEKYGITPGGGRSKIPDGDDTEDYPVENVSWEEAREYCEKLNERDKKKLTGWVYRLPTEAEWEYSCRGGVASQAFHFGNSLSSNQANFDGNYPYGAAKVGKYLERTCLVGGYQKNPFGLCDMHGNVLEWCLDWYGADYYGKSPALARDPRGPGGSYRVFRGGSWRSYGQRCRSACRGRSTPADRDRDLGFRVALVPSERK